MSFSNFQHTISQTENPSDHRKKEGISMTYGTSCHGSCGSFLMGAAAGMAAGAALGAVMAPSSRQIKRAAHKAARRVNEAVDHLADAMDL